MGKSDDDIKINWEMLYELEQEGEKPKTIALQNIGKIISDMSKKGLIKRRGYKLRLKFGHINKYIVLRLKDRSLEQLKELLNELCNCDGIDLDIKNGNVDMVIWRRKRYERE